MAWHEGVKTGLAVPVAVGLIALLGGFGGFAAWAGLAPISGAVVAPAKVVAEGRNKVVQHLEGGIVKDILVAEGQKVAAGEAMLVLDGTAARSEARRLKAQLAGIEAAEARTLAERDGTDELRFPDLLALVEDPEVIRLLDDQRAEFEVRLRKHKAEIAVLGQQVAALEEQIIGHEVQQDETRRQILLLAEEREGLEILLEKGLTRKPQVLALKRAEAELKGRQGQLVAAVAEARQSIAEIRERMEQARSTRLSEASAQLAELRAKRADVLERLRAAEEVSSRLTVRAPVSGTVINLTKHSASAVISPGQELLTIVPADGGLVVEARVRPGDIDDVHLGQEAWMTFSAFDMRQTPPVPARLVYLSADRMEEERTGEAFYVARLEMKPEPSSAFDPSRVGPGHEVQVFFTTGERTFFEYLLDPVTKTFSRAFRES